MEILLKLITLGSGNAFGHGNQFQSAHYIEFEEKFKILLDCGPTILQAIQATETNLDDLQFLLISHLHGDHMAGIPFLLLHYKFVLQRFSNPLQIYGPPGLKEQLDNLIRGNYPNALTNEDNLYKVHEIQLQEEKVLFGSIVVNTFEANHIPNSFCYIIAYKGLKVIYSGDNELKPPQIKEFTDGTVLLHELTTMNSTAGGHTSWTLLRQHIDDILTKVGKVVVIHSSMDVREEPESTFTGKVIRAQDGSSFFFNEKGRMYQMLL